MWIEPEVTDDESRRLLANSVAPFLSYYSTVGFPGPTRVYVGNCLISNDVFYTKSL